QAPEEADRGRRGLFLDAAAPGAGGRLPGGRPLSTPGRRLPGTPGPLGSEVSSMSGGGGGAPGWSAIRRGEFSHSGDSEAAGSRAGGTRAKSASRSLSEGLCPQRVVGQTFLSALARQARMPAPPPNTASARGKVRRSTARGDGGR